MIIFPLSVGGRIVLMLVAVILGLICWMMWKPDHWRWLFKKLRSDDKEKVIEEQKRP